MKPKAGSGKGFTVHPYLSQLVLGLLLSFVSLGVAQDVTPDISSRAFDLARQLRCPVCTSESVADSGAEVSLEMRRQIETMLQAGSSNREVLAYFQARYGDWILLEPPRRGIHLVVWLLPLVAATAGVLALTLLLRHWLGRSRTPVEASEEDRQRVRRALEGEG